jgi:hypothetical protein
MFATIPSRENLSSAQNSAMSNLRRWASSNSRANSRRRSGPISVSSCVYHGWRPTSRRPLSMGGNRRNSRPRS